MENIKEYIEERLWNVINKNYTSKNYTNAILDAIQFIGDIIREKSGLDNDGNQLIGGAFGGNNPKIKINKLNTESEKNVQKGIESILRGIYTAYRNPRSHSVYKDSEVDAYEIIIFINHLLKLIDISKGKFSTEQFLKRVFDEDFVQDDKYSSLLINDIPKKKLIEVAIEIFRLKEQGNIHNVIFVWKSIYNDLSNEEKIEILDLASDELRYTNSLKVVIRCIALFEREWIKLDEDSRFRAENKIIKHIPLAEKNIYGEINDSGVYASWLTSIIRSSLLRSKIAEYIYDSLESSNIDRQRFVIDYFGNHLNSFEKNLFLVSFKDLFRKELKNGNKLIYDYITSDISKKRQLEYKEEIENFVDSITEDDLPF